MKDTYHLRNVYRLTSGVFTDKQWTDKQRIASNTSTFAQRF